jgi:hypothetical protein
MGFCIRQSDFESNLSCAIREFREESCFFDVTLMCDDRPMQAHKVILAANSELFKAMLRTQTGNPNPLIYLRGVRTTDLESLLNFMYLGEVNVAQDDLDSFLAVAVDLQIKGLAQNTVAALAAFANDKNGDSNEINIESEPFLESSVGDAAVAQAVVQDHDGGERDDNAGYADDIVIVHGVAGKTSLVSQTRGRIHQNC